MSGISELNQAELDGRYRVTALIVGVQIISVLILCVLAWIFAGRAGDFISSQTVWALWISVLFIAVGTFILRRNFFSWERLKNTALVKGVPGLFSTLQINTLILCGLGEIIAIIGFIVAVVSGGSFEMFRAGAVALIVLLFNFPRKRIWEKIGTALEKV